MAKILFAILLLFIKENNSYETNNNNKNETITPGISKTFRLKYLENTCFSFNSTEFINDSSSLLINIHSINCKIDVTSKGGKPINNSNLEIYSISVNSNDTIIYVKPFIDTIDGLFREDYEKKTCPLTINSYYTNIKQNLTIKNYEENVLLFDSSIYNSSILHIYYNKINISTYSFVALNFRFEKASFKINISNIKKNSTPIIKYINSSTFIYLNNDFLLNGTNDTNRALSIDITNNNNESIYIYFKIVEDENLCLLDRNDLNFGFITSNSTYQYYYAEILKGEEGELMLHNKRLYGKLHAIITNKTEIDKLGGPKEKSNYPKGTSSNETELEYNGHKLQLKFNFSKTEKCVKGCYILITYEPTKSEEYFPLIGYEYTILSRIWNYTDSASKLIEIPSNEYIIGCFDQGTSPEHFYTIHIPNDVEKILIQIEGNYFEAFYEGDRKKINTWNMFGEYVELVVNNSKNATYIDKSKVKNNYLSFLFNYDEYINIIFSYYYFRVIFIKNNDKYLPIDSNFDNPCLPEKNNDTGYYYCYFILKNYYDELNEINFAISSENQDEYVGIDILIKYKNENQIEKSNTYFTYINDELIKDVDYILFTFEFTNNEIKNIISSFCDKIENIYPHVYSGQMYYLNNFTKINNFKMNNDYFLKYQFLYGDLGVFDGTIQHIAYFNHFNINQNFKGKPITIPLDENFSFSTTNTTHIFYCQLINYMKIKGIEEVKIGEPLTQLMKEFTFPLYYYINLKNKSYINIDINVRFQKYMLSDQNSKYSVNGYIINEDNLIKKIKEDNVLLENPIIGSYFDAFGIGLLQVNQTFDNNNSNNNNYLLIEINNLDKSNLYTNNLSIIEISCKEYDENESAVNKEYILPVNKYIIETFNEKRNENKYCIYKTEKHINPILIEISTEYDDIDIEFEKGLIYGNVNEVKEKGFKKYMINNTINGTINFKVKKKNQKNQII